MSQNLNEICFFKFPKTPRCRHIYDTGENATSKPYLFIHLSGFVEILNDTQRAKNFILLLQPTLILSQDLQTQTLFKERERDTPSTTAMHP